MFHPNQFKVNEVWIAARINDSFIYVQSEPYDMYVLIDSGSCYVMGFVLSKVADEAPKEYEVDDLFKKAWSLKNEWPKKVIMPENDLAEDVFKKVAIKNHLLFETVELSDLSLIIGELKESFEKDFMRKP